MTKADKYLKIIWWSEHDGCFVGVARSFSTAGAMEMILGRFSKSFVQLFRKQLRRITAKGKPCQSL